MLKGATLILKYDTLALLALMLVAMAIAVRHDSAARWISQANGNITFETKR